MTKRLLIFALWGPFGLAAWAQPQNYNAQMSQAKDYFQQKESGDGSLIRKIMALKPKNANIDVRQTARVFDEQAFVDGVFNDDYILVVGGGVMLDCKQFPNSKGDVNQYIIDEINN